MAIELAAPARFVGQPFSTAFAVCAGCDTDLSHGWALLDPATHLFTKDRYNACPTIRFVPEDGYFYLLTLFSAVPPAGTFDTVIVRSRDLVSWSPAPTAPRIVLRPNATTGSLEHTPMPGSTLDLCGDLKSDLCARWWGPPSWQMGPAFRENAANYSDTDASDIDFVELPGNATHGPSTYITYCTGNQKYGFAYNAAAVVDSPMNAWLQSYFSDATDSVDVSW